MAIPPLYFDHNVSGYALQLLRRSGHDVVAASDVDLAAAGDEVHLASAANLDRVLISHNAKDFRLLHDAWLMWTNLWGVVEAHSGILILFQQPIWSPARTAAEIVTFFDSGLVIENELYEWRRGRRQWERRFQRGNAPTQRP